MLQYIIQENKEDVLKRLAIKNFKDAESIINSVIELDNNRKAAQRQADDTKAEANTLAKQIGELMKSGKKDEAETLKAKTADLKSKEKEFDETLKNIEARDS
jgi:seryl-tRNA synthetase